MEFQELENLRLTLAGIRDAQVKSLSQYYDKDSNGFFHFYGDPKNEPGDFSKASTSTCVLSLIATGKWSTEPWGCRSSELAKAMLSCDWVSAGLDENNPFTVAFILESVTALVRTMPEDQAGLFGQDNGDRIAEAKRILLDSVAKGYAQIKPYPPSAYLTQLVVRTLQQASALPDNLNKEVEEWAWHEIEHQLALLVAKSKTADLFQLAYSLILTASLGDPAKTTPDRNLISNAALEQLFRGQLEDGSWPRSRPLFHYREVGSAYCYEYEMLVQLVREPRLQSKLLHYLSELEKAARALKETAFKLGADGLGWSSGHHPQLEGPESWSTASAYHFIHVLDRLVAEAARKSIFEYFSMPYQSPEKPKSDEKDFAPSFLDCPIGEPEEGKSLRSVLFQCFVRPVAEESHKIEAGGSLSPGTPMSAIFFGPPGTSKTELTKQIADYLRWPRLMIDPSHFVRGGMDKVQAEADHIFGMLAAAEQIVVLLDEFDEMVRDRIQANELLSRFLTTAMLPKLARINRNRRIVFIVATNHIDQFDLAISRPGRFDITLQVMPPTANAKLGHWRDVAENLKKVGLEVNQGVRNKIEALTFDEFRSLAPRLVGAINQQEALRYLDEAFERCTLNARLDPHGAEKKTWAEICKDQRIKTRCDSQSTSSQK